MRQTLHYMACRSSVHTCTLPLLPAVSKIWDVRLYYCSKLSIVPELWTLGTVQGSMQNGNHSHNRCVSNHAWSCVFLVLRHNLHVLNAARHVSLTTFTLGTIYRLQLSMTVENLHSRHTILPLHHSRTIYHVNLAKVACGPDIDTNIHTLHLYIILAVRTCSWHSYSATTFVTPNITSFRKSTRNNDSMIVLIYSMYPQQTM